MKFNIEINMSVMYGYTELLPLSAVIVSDDLQVMIEHPIAGDDAADRRNVKYLNECIQQS